MFDPAPHREIKMTKSGTHMHSNVHAHQHTCLFCENITQVDFPGWHLLQSVLGGTLSGLMGTYGCCEPTMLRGCDVIFEADLCGVPEASQMQTQGHMNDSWLFT